ncbi:hypothetical protein MHY87_16775 [Microvirga sp. ACRRW]|uniref:calcium-binding protein n=1 Tax=Microvirga sp. ACRRW TaxID=2918205 RepID=UPI001EF67CEB|nr:calcium-binding protein [Microvirga sp. ACRRW]MCG7394561.1 hypothetical protein [Microvirga sp. ACRRW]
MTSPNAWGSIFSVNTTTKADQYLPKMHALKDGSFVAIWQDDSRAGADKSSSAIRGQLFNADGSKKGGEFLVNTINTNGWQGSPVVTVLNDGRFVVAWEDELTGFIMGRAYQANGAAVGDEFKISSTGEDHYASITARANGGFAVSYRDEDGKNRIKNFDANLQAGSEAVLGTTSSITKIVGLQGHSILFSGATGDIRGLIVNDDGTVPAGGKPFVIPTTGEYNYRPVATKLADGRVLVAWASDNFTSSGNEVSQIKGQILNANGTLSGGELVLSAADLVDSEVAAVTALADGGFAVAYIDQVEDRNSADIHVASFTSNGVRVSDDIVERAYDRGYENIEISGLADGRVAVSWTNSVSQFDDFGTGIHGQILDLRQKAVTVNGTAGDDWYFGSRFSDTLNGNGGNDVLNGAGGADRMAGGAGNDTYYVDHKSDRAIETSSRDGIDTVYASLSHTLGAHVEKLIGTGSAAIALTGNSLANTITGNGAKNTIKGQSGNDVINGGYGNDVLYGGSGRDSFVFDTALNKGANVDALKDFNVKDDTIRLDNAIFTKLTATGTLNRAFFKIGAKAEDRNDFVLYNDETGALSYDADGSGRGAAIKIAQLKAGLDLTARDFIVI